MTEKFKDIFAETITVSEKIDAHRFSFTKDDSGNFTYYKKMSAIPITAIDRTISDLYEDAIQFIEDLDDDVKNEIPVNIRFSFYYMSSRTPLRITYKNVDDTLILTDLSERTDSGKSRNVISDSETLKKWADKFDCGLPIIFEGKLTNYQKELMEGFLLFEDESLLLKPLGFNTKFTWLVNEIFGKTYTENSIISGVYIKTPNDNLKFSNPIFQVIFHESIEPISRDFYDLMLKQLKDFLQEFDLDGIDVSSITDTDLKYITIVSAIFNKFALQLEPDINPSFLQPNIIGDLGDFNAGFAIRDEETLRLLYSSDFYIEVFKMMLLVLKKPRKTYGLLGADDITILNNAIENIKKLIE